MLPKIFENAKTLKELLKKKQLPCLFDYDSVFIESQSHSRESLSLNVEPDSTSNAVATSKTTSFVNTSEESTLIESAAPNISTASTVMTSPPTSSTLFSSNVFDELSFSPPPIEYRLFFNRIDVSAQFYQFQLDVQNRLRGYAVFAIEERMQHLCV